MVNYNSTHHSAIGREIELMTAQTAPASYLGVETTSAPHPERVRTLLAQILQTDIIDQLVESHKSVVPGSADAQPPGAKRPSLDDQLLFQALLIDGDVFDCTSFLGDLRYQGASVEDIYVELFAPVARAIGSQWENDTLTFLDATNASSRLQSLVHTICVAPQERPTPNNSHRIILARLPGEQHSLGALIVSRLLEMDGWDVIAGPDLFTGNEMNDLVHSQWFGVIGLSASTPERASSLNDVILELRRSSLNRHVAVLVGGNGFARHPEIADEIGADGLAIDGRDAVTKAEQLIHDNIVRIGKLGATFQHAQCGSKSRTPK